jgi:hypothetical protein
MKREDAVTGAPQVTGIVRARIAELPAETAQQLERDGQRFSLTRRAMAEMLIAISSSPSESASLDNPLCVVRYVGKEGRMVAAFPDKIRAMELLTKLLGWCEPTQISISVDPLQSLLNSIRARVETPQAKADELPVKRLGERTMTVPFAITACYELGELLVFRIS